MNRMLAVWVLSIGLTSGTGGRMAGLVLQCEGEVGVRFDQSESSEGQALPMMMLPPGGILNVPAQASAKVLCASNNLVEITGPLDWMADEASCRDGRALDEPLFRSLMTSASPVSVTRSGDGAALKTRAPHPGSLLWVLAPRGDTRQDRPRLMWSAPRNAAYFQWTLSSGSAALATKLVEAAALCRAADAERAICRMDYPSIAGPLTAGRLMDLKVRMVGADMRPTQMEDESSFSLFAPETAQALNQQLTLLEEAPLTPQGSCLARSRLLEAHGALGAAIEALLECPGETGSPLFDRPLARLYLISQLARAALPHLESLAGQFTTPCQRAEIDLGFGRAYFLLAEHRRADGLLRNAVNTLGECGTDVAHGLKWIEDNKQYLN